MNAKHFEHGVLVQEIRDGIEVTDNLGKTPLEIAGYNDTASSVQPSNPIPYIQWPVWAKALNQFSKPEDKGIGDVIARMIGDENSEAFKMWYRGTFGKACGCARRQAKWNLMYPLST
jgi:hypothetical protein